MRFRFVVAGFVAAIMLLPTAAAAQAEGDVVTVRGSLYSSPTDVLFAIGGATLDARSGPSGENPTGTFSARFGGGFGISFTGTVTCVAVSGNRAVIGVEGTVDFGPFAEPFVGVIVVTDGGPTVTQPPWPDTFSFASFVPPGPTNCSLTPPPATTYAATDVTVSDVQPLPTSKDQCKNGGWRNYGETFKNQGQCVAFVQRGPKP